MLTRCCVIASVSYLCYLIYLSNGRNKQPINRDVSYLCYLIYLLNLNCGINFACVVSYLCYLIYLLNLKFHFTGSTGFGE
nr:MAG TPA: hypothetical protein [Caudoviricetes sp.]